MPRFKLTIEYAGTRYSGWQIQKNATTVQGEIDRAVRAVTKRNDFELYGSGRTDAGVHALAQVAHLDVVTSLPAETLARRINDELPADINILAAAPVPHRFHARHDAVARRYLYQIARRRTAFAKAFVWWVRETLDAERMRDAARPLVGMRDFRSFAAADPAPAPAALRRGKADDDAPPSTLVLVNRLDIVRSRRAGRSRAQGAREWREGRLAVPGPAQTRAPPDRGSRASRPARGRETTNRCTAMRRRPACTQAIRRSSRRPRR